jgi:hypothetical protein
MMTTEKRTGRQYADTAMGAWVGREADDVPPGWMDNVVRRLLEQVNRQLIRAEDIKSDTDENDAKTRDLNSRTLQRLELMLGRLIRLETERAKTRTTKASDTNGSAMEELQRRLDHLAAARGTDEAAGEGE